MKRLLSLLSICFFAIYMSAQPSIEWQFLLGGIGDDYGSSAQQTADGGFVVAGHIRSDDIPGYHGSEDFWVVKMDNTGMIQWQKALGGSNSDNQPYIQQTADGGYLLVGTTKSNNGDVDGHHGGLDGWVVKLSSSGNIEWQRALGGSKLDAINTFAQTSDGGYIVAGVTNSDDGDVPENHGASDFFVAKLSSTGTIQWRKALGGTGGEQARFIRQTFDGGFIISGESSSNDGDVTGQHGENDCWIVKLSNLGAVQWEKAFGGTSEETEGFIQLTNDGGYIFSCGTLSNDGDIMGNHGESDYLVVKLSPQGMIQWRKCLGGTKYDRSNFIQQVSDGGYVVAGYSDSNDGNVTGNHGSSDYWMVKISNDGEIQWQKSIGGSLGDGIYDIKQTMDGGFVLTGEAHSNDGDISGNHGEGDCWIVKTSNLGVIEWTKSLGGSQNDLGFVIAPCADGGYFVLGSSSSNNGDVSGQNGVQDFWVIKLSSDMVDNEELIPFNIATYLEVYPNPAVNNIFVNNPSAERFMSLQIVNSTGQILLQQTIQNGASLNISHLPMGNYSILATTPSGKRFSNKISKQD